MTRFQKGLVEDVIMEKRTLDREQLTYFVSDILVERYDNDYLESHLQRVGLETTKKIREAIDEYVNDNPDRLRELGLLK